MPPKPYFATSFRMSHEGQRTLAAIAERLGITKTAALEVLIRHYRDYLQDRENKMARS